MEQTSGEQHEFSAECSLSDQMQDAELLSDRKKMGWGKTPVYDGEHSMQPMKRRLSKRETEKNLTRQMT
ncbi:hypothetical protein GJAV_G00060110 [Gymnothorax javanicus]|nr:hypothetical protein GJAV_G00060110 [Gymnothorax javanicus]